MFMVVWAAYHLAGLIICINIQVRVKTPNIVFSAVCLKVAKLIERCSGVKALCPQKTARKIKSTVTYGQA